MHSEKLKTAVITEIKKNLASGDETAIDGLLDKVAEIHLIGFLPEEEWKNHGDKDTIDEDMNYMANGASTCPKCGSDDISADHADADGEYIVQPVDCNDCDHTWKDVFKLEGIEK